MPTYTTDEVTFELPDGFVDRSITVLNSKDLQHPMSLVINRDDAAMPLEEHVAAAIQAIQKAAPGTKVLGQRTREVGHLPAREVRFSTVAAKKALYVRQAYLAYYDTILSFSLSAVRTQQPKCDAVADRLLSNVQFRRR
jgi:hypothetical protein